MPRSRLLLALLAGLGAVALHAQLSAADERIPLVVRPLDEVFLKNGGQPVKGRVVEKLPDGGVRVRRPGETTSSEILLAGADIDHIDSKQSAADAVRGRGQQDLDAGDIGHFKTTLKWGIDNGAKDAVLTLAKVAMAKRASAELAEMIEPLLEEQEDYAGAAALVTPLLDADPQWTFGYEALTRIYLKQDKQGELAKLVDRWLLRQPSAPTPNRLRAAAAELSGDLRTAQHAFHNLFDLHHDYAAGLGYARTSLKRGDYAEALQTAETLVQANQFIDDARAIAGSALLAQGDLTKAEPLLTQALAGKLAPELADITSYNLGLVAYRAGHLEQAQQQWKSLSLPAADLGLAMIEGRAYGRAKDLPPDLKAIAIEYNACVELENSRYDQAAALLDPRSSRRQSFLAQVAALKNPSEDAIKALANTPGPESIHWQLYADILTRRWTLAEAALAQLPANDGYAAVCRVFIAEARRDSAGARTAFAAVRESIDPPREYVEKLAHEYEAVDDQLSSEHFEGATADLTARDWKFSQQGTGIQVHTVDGRLVLEGTQTAGDDPVTRVFKAASGPRLRSIQATIDVGGANGAVCGIEMLDLGHANGVAFGVGPDNHLGWRRETDGAWGQWQPLPVEAHTTQVLRLEFERGTITAVSPEEPTLRKPLVTGAFKDQAELHVGVFGTADAGVAWSLGAREFLIQLRAPVKAAPHR